MTQTDRNNAILALIESRTAEIVVDRKTARAALISEGIYTQKGKLRAEYGGVSKKKPSAA